MVEDVEDEVQNVDVEDDLGEPEDAVHDSMQVATCSSAML